MLRNRRMPRILAAFSVAVIFRGELASNNEKLHVKFNSGYFICKTLGMEDEKLSYVKFFKQIKLKYEYGIKRHDKKRSIH